jgi:dihydrofolate reductase
LIVLIGAMSQNRVIGKNNQLPWQLPADLAYFKAITVGQTVVMGRNTFESLGRPLAGRTNIVLSATSTFQPPGVLVARSIKMILDRAKTETIFIIGGSCIYHLFLPYAKRIYLTLIEAVFEGDVFFPEINATWQLVSEIRGFQDLQNPLPHRFLVYEKAD